VESEGKVTGIRGVLTDITDRRRAQEALAAEKERLAVTLRSIGDGVIATDTEGNILLLNKVAEQLTGWSQEEARGRPLDEVFKIINERTRQAAQNPVEKVLATGEVVGLANHTALISRDGTERIIADSGAPILDQSSSIIGVVLAFRDVTEKEKMEKEMLKTGKLESLGVLAGGIAHDFNNILTTILANVSLLKTGAQHDDPVYVSLDEAEQACLRARDLTQQLLTFSKGGAPIQKTASILDLLKDSASFALTGTNVRCAFELTDSLWPVEIDAGQISQVIHNLALNAQQAMPEGGTVRIAAENVFLQATMSGLPIPAGRYVKISVEDSGVGIPEEHFSKIFDPYFTTKQEGSGLGLATSFSIVRRHDGYLTVDSRLGEGSTFTIYLPASARKVQTEPAVQETIVEGFGKILLMDDEERIRAVTGQILRTLGYRVEVAANGSEVIAFYQQAMKEEDRFDVVILDLTIPGGMGGKETIKKLHEIDPQVKAIVSSGYSNDPIMAGFRHYGFRGIVAKPYRVAELQKVLHEVMNEKDRQ
jgi:PAS domain S-box-containing protein